MAGGHDATSSTSEELGSLFQEGSAVLVIGEDAVSESACHRLQGGADPDHRNLFLASMKELGEVLERQEPRRTDPEHFGVIDVDGTARDAATVTTDVTTEPASPASTWYTRCEGLTDTDRLLDLVSTHLDRLADPDGPPVRVCVDALDPFYHDLEAGELTAFLEALIQRVKESNGFLHVHVSPYIDPADIDVVGDLFDAFIQLRVDQDGTAFQKWQLRESDSTTEWFPLDASN